MNKIIKCVLKLTSNSFKLPSFFAKPKTGNITLAALFSRRGKGVGI
jgi:hypothetical protein